MGLGWRAHAPTLGSLVGRAGGGPWDSRSAATRGPTFTKNEFMTSGVTDGETRTALFLPPMTSLAMRQTEPRPCAATLSPMCRRLSDRNASTGQPVCVPVPVRAMAKLPQGPGAVSEERARPVRDRRGRGVPKRDSSDRGVIVDYGTKPV